MIEGWRGVRHRECDLRGREGWLWQLSVAEEVSLELMGHQDSPRRVTAKCKCSVCGTTGETHGSYQGSLAWGEGGGSCVPHQPSLTILNAPPIFLSPPAQTLWLHLYLPMA